eukprot:TRINITY_DN1239_c0_g1_i3.p1 TRINITY_DN1239_c0_g1~~TRINITY_DN1239_c0_g1_i3.p1  ORF type:complete len:420 (+),score=89.52 TRINITY_DN1239_c0_g1_i3:27-1262(+)
MPRKAYVVGVGMTRFTKPNLAPGGPTYVDFVREAVTQALEDAHGLPFTAIQQVTAGYVYGPSTKGQKAIYSVGLTGVPVYNVNNNCSTGSTALMIAKQFVEGGINDCVLAIGFEKMEPGSLESNIDDPADPLHDHYAVLKEVAGFDKKIPQNPQLFAAAANEHMRKHGSKPWHYASIAEKNHRHSSQNPRAQFRDVYTLDQVMQSREIIAPITKLQCSPTSDGAAAAIVMSEDFVRKYNLFDTAVEIMAMTMVTDLPSTFNEHSAIKMVGVDMTRRAADQAYAQAGITPADIQVIELHDCFSSNELLTYEGLSLTAPGQGHTLVETRNNTYGGKWVVNPSGGLISKGHPLGATGLAQCAELCWQIRGLAGPRQVSNVKHALQHNFGIGGAVIVGIYKKAFTTQQAAVKAKL